MPTAVEPGERWTRVVWRLLGCADRMARETLVAASIERRGRRGKTKILPCLDQQTCPHPPASIFNGGNQHASYSICRLCGATVKYVQKPPGSTKKKGATSSKKGAKSEEPQPRPSTAPAYVRTPPKASVEEYLEQALKPIIETQTEARQMMCGVLASLQAQQTQLAAQDK